MVCHYSEQVPIPTFSPNLTISTGCPITLCVNFSKAGSCTPKEGIDGLSHNLWKYMSYFTVAHLFEMAGISGYQNFEDFCPSHDHQYLLVQSNLSFTSSIPFLLYLFIAHLFEK